MVSDSELVERLREFLQTSDLNTTTTAIVRRKLEEDFGIDLSEKKSFIREQVDIFLQSQFEKAEDAEEEEADEEVDNEEEEGKVKIKSEDNNSSNSEEEEEEEDKVKEEKSKEVSNGKGGKKKSSNKLNKDVKRKGGGFSKLCSLSPQLQTFVGVPEMARTEVVKQLWAYIRENNLQDPNNKRNILCDEKLHVLFHVDSIDMFQMNKALSKHIWPLESEDAQVKPANKEKKRKQGLDESKSKEKRQKGGGSGGGSGFLAPLPISDALMKFIGTGESALSRASVVKRIWDYIKENNLQDPSDKRQIICDAKLKELFEVDSFTGFTVPKLLAVHFVKT